MDQVYSKEGVGIYSELYGIQIYVFVVILILPTYLVYASISLP